MEHFNRTFKEKPGATLLSVIYSSELCAHIKATKQCFFTLTHERLSLQFGTTNPDSDPDLH